MTNLPKNAGLPNQLTQVFFGVPAAVISAAILLFLMEAGVASLAA